MNIIMNTNTTNLNSSSKATTSKDNIVAVDTNSWSINFSRQHQIIQLQLEHKIELQQKQLELQKHEILRLQKQQRQRIRGRTTLFSPKPTKATNKKKITMNTMISSPDTTHSSLSTMSISENPLYDHDIKSIVSPTSPRQVDSSSNVWKFEGIDRVRKDG